MQPYTQHDPIPEKENFKLQKSPERFDKVNKEPSEGAKIMRKLSEGFQSISSTISSTAHDLYVKVFPEYPNPEKDLDPQVKQTVRKINDEVTHMPHMAEKVVEGQGTADPEKLQQQRKMSLPEKASKYIFDLSDKIAHGIENFAEKLQGDFEPEAFIPPEERALLREEHKRGERKPFQEKHVQEKQEEPGTNYEFKQGEKGESKELLTQGGGYIPKKDLKRVPEGTGKSEKSEEGMNKQQFSSVPEKQNVDKENLLA